MNKISKSLRDRLIESEQFSLNLKEKYEKEIRAMLEIKMSKIFRWSYLVGGILALGVAAFFAYGAMLFKGVMFYKDSQIWGRIIFSLGSIFSLAWAGLMLWIAKTGTFHLKKHPSAIAGLTWVGTVLLTTIFLVMAARDPDSTKSVFIVVASSVFLICASAGLILMRVVLAELNTRERLLKIELRLAELADEMHKKG